MISQMHSESHPETKFNFEDQHGYNLFRVGHVYNISTSSLSGCYVSTEDSDYEESFVNFENITFLLLSKSVRKEVKNIYNVIDNSSNYFSSEIEITFNFEILFICANWKYGELSKMFDNKLKKQIANFHFAKSKTQSLVEFFEKNVIEIS
jgi:hypothetical protein